MARTTPLRSLIPHSEGLAADLRSGGESIPLDALPFAVEELAADILIARSSDERGDLAIRVPSPAAIEPERARPLRTLELRPSSLVLEIGATWGTMARQLATSGHVVDVVDADPERAALAAAALQSTSARVFAGRLVDVPAVPQYDAVVVTDAGDAFAGASARSAVDEIRQRLKTDGVVIIVGTNAAGVSRLGATFTDDASATQRADTPAADPRGFVDALSDATRVRQLALFPDIAAPRVLMDVEALRAEAPFLVSALAGLQASGREPAGDPAALWSMWSQLPGAGAVADGFVISAQFGDAPDPWPEGMLARYWSVGRAESQSAENSVVLKDGVVVIRRRKEWPVDNAHETVALREYDQPLVDGSDLVEELGSARDVDTARTILAEWVKLVDASAADGEVLWDLVPHNVLRTPAGLIPIDQEWLLLQGGPDVVVRRGLFWLSARMDERGLRPAWLAGDTVTGAAETLGELINLEPGWTDLFFEEEARAVADVWRPDFTVSQAERTPDLAGLLRATGKKQLSTTSRDGENTELGKGDFVPAEDSYVSMSRSLKSLRQELEDTRRELASKEAAFESQEAELVAARQRADELSSSVRHNELQHRDHVVGLEAKLVTAEERVAGIDASALKWRRIAEERGKKIRGLRRQLLKAQETSAKRLREVRDLRASRSWRIGRVITRPFAGLRRSR